MNEVVLLIGGNIGAVATTLLSCREVIEITLGKLIKISPVYQTQAWGYEHQPDFLNQALLVQTEFSPLEVLDFCLKIEADLGRKRFEKWHERTIDIDLIYFNEEIVDLPNLIIPHPLLAERKFVLQPLADIIPQYIHPIFKRTQIDLLANCKDPLDVLLYS